MSVDEQVLVGLAKALGWFVDDRPDVIPAIFPHGSSAEWETPDWLLSGDGMVAVVEALRDRGYWLGAFSRSVPGLSTYEVEIEGDDGLWQSGCADTLPEAVVLAAARALGVES